MVRAGRRRTPVQSRRMPRVLLAEDDGVIARAMMAHLRRAGMDVEWAEDGDRALRKIRFERPDVTTMWSVSDDLPVMSMATVCSALASSRLRRIRSIISGWGAAAIVG